MIWDIFEANPHFGRHRIANILWLLGVFVAASTVRNILLQRPNHVWSVDRTRVLRWGLWPTWVLVAIDHYSRAVMAVVPLEGPNAGWAAAALEDAFLRHGAPCHIITDQEALFVSDAFAGLLTQRGVKHRFGAVGKHGSIAVTERVILTLKYEWLNRVPVIRGLDHLSQLLHDFETYYNEYRGHTRLGGAVPSVMHRGEHWTKPEKSAKVVPANVERCIFADTQITACRLAA
jgi:transposase InsO family protein